MGDCIESTLGSWTTGGHRQVRVNGQRMYVHRMVYVQHHGPIPDGMVVMHTCDNPPCVNINHLRLGTQGDNMRDKADKGRARNQNTGRTHCKWGHEFTTDNTYVRPDGRRACRSCQRQREKGWRASTHPYPTGEEPVGP